MCELRFWDKETGRDGTGRDGTGLVVADVMLQRIRMVATGSGQADDITHYGGISPDGAPWWLSADELVAAIAQGEHTFYALVQGVRAKVGLCLCDHGAVPGAHLDGQWTDCLTEMECCNDHR